MTTMGVTVFYNRVQIPGSDKDQLMLLRTLQDNESNIIGNRSLSSTTKNCVIGTAAGGVGGAATPTPAQQTSAVTLPPYDPSRLKKHGKNGQPPPVAVARRNARERNRVKQVNDGFAMLRQKIPNHVAAGYGDRGKKLSKVETLRMAVEYIRGLQRLLAEADGLEYETGQAMEHGLPTPSPTGSAFSGSTHNGSGEILSVEDEQPVVKEEEAEYLLDLEEDEEEREKRGRKNNPLVARHSPSVRGSSVLVKRRKSSQSDFYGQSAGDEENVEPNDARGGFVRFSPNNSAPSPTVKNEFRGGQTEEHLQTRVIMSPYMTTSEVGNESANPEEVPTTVVYAPNLEPLSGTLYYKHEISEPGEFIDVVSWWEQEQARLVHHTQPHAQRLTHV